MSKEYKGSCHCGAVRYTANVDIDNSISCNCSMCGRSGTILSFVPLDQFHLESGEDNLTDYQFNKKVIHHYFCKTCGIRPFGRGTGPDGVEMAAINVRCLEGIDAHALKPHPYNGKDV